MNNLRLTLLAFLLLTFPVVKAQQPSTVKKIIYKIKLLDINKKTITGYLKNINDSSLVYTNKKVHFSATENPTDKTISYNNITSIKLRRRGTTERGALIGAVSGFAVGASIALIEGDDPPDRWFHQTKGEKVLNYGILSAATGSIVGMISGALIKKNFTINGDKERFMAMKGEIFHKTYK